MPGTNAQSPASAVLLLDALAWMLEQLPVRDDPRDEGARARTVQAVRDAATAAVEQHRDWSRDQLALARTYGNGDWQAELLRAVLGTDHANLILRRTVIPAH